MFSELLQRQLRKEVEFIFDDNQLDSFVKSFFSNLIEDIDYKNIEMFISFAPSSLYVQLSWTEEDGSPVCKEFKIPYDEYNKWGNSLIVNNSGGDCGKT